MIREEGIDIKLAELLINGNHVGYVKDLTITFEKPRTQDQTIGGQVEHRSGSDRYTWKAGMMTVTGKVQEQLALAKKSGGFVIEVGIADETGATERVTVPSCRVTHATVAFSENSATDVEGTCDEPY